MNSFTTLAPLGALFLMLSSCGQISNGGTSKTARLNASRKLAITWAETASTEAESISNIATLNKLDDIMPILENRELIIDLSSSGPCAENTEEEFTLAYVEVPPKNSNIYVCTEAFDFSNDIIAQVLIHESIHITGVTDECNTTEYEVNIMDLAGQRPFKNSYVDDPSCSSKDFSGINFVVLSDESDVGSSGLKWKNAVPLKGLRY